MISRSSIPLRLLLLLSLVFLLGLWLAPPRGTTDSVTTSTFHPTEPDTQHHQSPSSATISTASSESLTGEAAKVELRRKGQYESLGEALAAARHAVEKIDPAGPHSRGAEYFASNPGQQLRAWFSGDGVELASGNPTPESKEPWSLKLRLLGVGRGDEIVAASPGTTTGEASRIEIHHRGAAVTQWFENSREGLEQGFTLHQPPTGDSSEVAVLLQPTGPLRGEAADEGDGIRFVDATGADVLRYGKLKAWDASGRELAARMGIADSGILTVTVMDAGAQYPVTIDPMFANVEARLSEEIIAGDEFGTAVAVAGDYALVGVPLDSTPQGVYAGTVHVLFRDGTSWRRQTKLVASDGGEAAYFGASVALSGDTALVGAPGHAPTMPGSLPWLDLPRLGGKAYVFVKGDTTWQQQAILAPDETDFGWFGHSVALSGDTALIGVPTGSGQIRLPGRAFVFVRSGLDWSQQAVLSPQSALQMNNYFGLSVAISGDTAVVGSPDFGPWSTAYGPVHPGLAYTFVRAGSSWTGLQIIGDPSAGLWTSSQPDVPRLFGYSVAMSGDFMVIGAPGTLGPISYQFGPSGSAYFYRWNGAAWTQEARFWPPGMEHQIAPIGFGASVAIDGNTAVITGINHPPQVFVSNSGAWSRQTELSWLFPDPSYISPVAITGDTLLLGEPWNDVDAKNAGAVYASERSAGEWGWPRRIEGGNDGDDEALGNSVAVSDDRVLVGVPDADAPSGAASGKAFVFSVNSELWILEATLSDSNGNLEDRFGCSVALSRDIAVIGAAGDDTPDGGDFGSAHVFVRSEGTWSAPQKLTAIDGSENDRFGTAVAIGGDSVLVGAPGEYGGGKAGSAHVFARVGDSWLGVTKLVAPNPAGNDEFGGAVAITADRALVGAPAFGQGRGGAYVFDRSGGVWGNVATLVGVDSYGSQFGRSIALSGDTALVGAPWEDTNVGHCGCAYVFARTGPSWAVQAQLISQDAAEGDALGVSVALVGEVALVGASRADAVTGPQSGAAYVFARQGVQWSQQLRLTASLDASAGDQFGSAVALSSDVAVIGAPFDDTVGLNAGSAYVFRLGNLPEIVRHPESRTVVPGQAVTFSVEASGYAPLGYQWRKDGYPIDGATGTSYTIGSAGVADQGRYDCVVSNIGGVVTSAAATLKVNDLSQFTQTFPGPPESSQGFLIVNITPAGLGGWRFAGEQAWRAGGVPVGGLATGNRMVEFMPVDNYIQPSPEPVGVVSGGAASFVNVIYYFTGLAGTGGLEMILKPDSIAGSAVPEAQRAQWRLFKLGTNNDPWLDSGENLAGLVSGHYLVECKPVDGWNTPPPVSVLVEDDETSLPTVTYFVKEPQTGAQPLVLPFETVSSSGNLPYAYVGQIRSDVGSSSGFVVKPRVVATAGHVVFDDGTLSVVTGLQWLFQRDSLSHEAVPVIPRGAFLLDDYAAARSSPGVEPGVGTTESQNRDAAALFFAQDAGRGGCSGYLASDAEDNEFLISSALKMLVGYPVDGTGFVPGRMHATTPMDVSFSRVPSLDEFGNPFRTYRTSEIHGAGGMSGGPLCVRFEEGSYYPAAIYLGGSNETIVRAIDSKVIDILTLAEAASAAGDNSTGGGITLSSFTTVGSSSDPGAITVTIEPAAARNADAGWRLNPETSYRQSGAQKSGLDPGSYVLELKEVSGFQNPTQQSVTVNGGQLSQITYTYALANTPPTISAIAEQDLAANTPTPALAFTIGDVETAASALTLGKASTNTTLVPEANIVFGGSGANRTVTVTPATGQLGVTTVTLTVSDGTLSASRSFLVTVTGTAEETWRFANFGTTVDAGNAADAFDADGDSQTNLEERAAGTDPNNPTDVFRVLTATRGVSSFAVTVPGRAGRTYVLERGDTPSGGVWIPVVTTGPQGVDGPIELTDSAPAGTRGFYRVKVVAP